ncbi:MAG: ATP-dependent DNA ligase, partial [Hyphomonadaceae bacterium]
MQSFAALLERLVLTPSRNAKLQLIIDYLRHTPDPSRGWAIAAITGDLNIPSVKPAAIRELVAARVDPILFNLSYDYVGDLAETISLIWPQRPGANRSPALDEIVETLMQSTKAQGLILVEGWLDALDASGRWSLLKLVTGGLRIGVSARLARQALADFAPKEEGRSVDVSEIEELWHGLTPPYLDLFAWLEGRAPKPIQSALAPFRPPM